MENKHLDSDNLSVLLKNIQEFLENYEGDYIIEVDSILIVFNVVWHGNIYYRELKQ